MIGTVRALARHRRIASPVARSRTTSADRLVDMSRQSATQDRTEVWWLLLIMVVGFFVAVVSHYVLGVYSGRPYPYNTFLFRPADAFDSTSPAITGSHFFGDLFVNWHHSGDPNPYLHPSTVIPSNYPPFTHLLFRPLSALPYTLALSIFLVGTTAAVLWLLAAQLKDVTLPLRLLAAGVIGLLNYPMLLMLDRGNVEGVVLLFLAAAALSAHRGAWTRSAVLIGAAAAMKGYPLLFVFLLLGARRYRDAAVALSTAAGLTLLSFSTMSGGVFDNARGFLRAVGSFEAFGAGDAGVQHGSSLHGLASVAAHIWPTMTWLPGVAPPLALVILLIGSVSVISGRLLLWQSCAVIAGLTILVPAVAFDYRLVLMLVPLLVLLREPGGSLRRPVVLMLGLLFVPKGLPVLYGEVNIGVVVNPLLLVLLVLGLSMTALRQQSTAAELRFTGKHGPTERSRRTVVPLQGEDVAP